MPTLCQELHLNIKKTLYKVCGEGVGATPPLPHGLTWSNTAGRWYGCFGILSRPYFPATSPSVFFSKELRAHDLFQIRDLNRTQKGRAWPETWHRAEGRLGGTRGGPARWVEVEAGRHGTSCSGPGRGNPCPHDSLRRSIMSLVTHPIFNSTSLLVLSAVRLGELTA